MKMFNKKIYVILLLFIVSICTMSAASASENVTDTVAIDDANSDDVVTSFDEDSNSEIQDNAVSSYNEDSSIANVENIESQGNDDSPLSSAKSDDVLRGATVYYSQYSINLNDAYEITGTKGGNIVYYMAPYQIAAVNAYNFYFTLYQLNENEGLTQVFQSNLISSDTNRRIGNYNYNFKAKSLTPGTYLLVATNYGDGHEMDRAILNVKGTAVITANDYNSFYDSGDKMTVKFTDKDTKAALKYISVRATFSNGKISESLDFITDSQGQISFAIPFAVGTYSVEFSSGFTHVSATPVKKAIIVKKAPVAVKAEKVTGYEGSKVTLKATVKSQGKNVNEGKVTFKINGKEYIAPVKDGVATKSLTLNNVKTYSYKATFNGANYDKSNTAYGTATVKKRSETKIIVSDQNVYRGDNKAFIVQVKTKAGENVDSGKVTIVDTIEVNKYGRAKFYTALDLNYIKQVGNKVYFKKKVTKTYTVKYTPSAKYKASTTKMKITMTYKCSACGSKTTHSHNGMTFIVT